MEWQHTLVFPNSIIARHFLNPPCQTNNLYIALYFRELTTFFLLVFLPGYVSISR